MSSLGDTPPEGYPVIQPPPQRQPAPTPPAEPRGPWWQRPRNLGVVIATLAVVLVAAVVGIFLAANQRSGEADRELAQARERIHEESTDARNDLEAERQRVEDEKSELEDKIDRLEDDAREARRAARREEKRLSRLQNQVSGAEQRIEDDTIPGDGTFVVGDDIQPGTYKSEGQEGCYWARLSGLGGDLEDIISNANTDGPVTITVAPGDAALELSGCAEFVRQGG